MNARRILVLLAAGILVLAGALWLGNRSGAGPDTLAGTRVLPALSGALNSITEVRLSRGDGTKTTLRRRESDWVVAERDYRADSGRVRKLLLDLAALEVQEEKTRDPANYARLGVEDVNSAEATGTLVEVVAGDATHGLIVGKTAGLKSTYVRPAGGEQSFLASPQLRVDAAPRDWIDRVIVDIPQDRVREVVVAPAGARQYTVQRESKDQQNFTVADLPKGRELVSESVANPIAGSLASLTLDEVHPRPSAEPAERGRGSQGRKAPSPSRATFRTFDGLTIEVTGRVDGDRRLVSLTAKSDAEETKSEAERLEARLQPWEFEIPTWKYDAIFRPLDELLK